MPLDRYQLDRTDPTRETRLVLGYGNITGDAIETTVQHLAEAIATESIP